MLSGLHSDSGQIVPAAQRSAYPLKSAKAPRAATTCDRADAAFVVLRQRIETLALQLAELEELRRLVLEAERSE
jgi:hypothetical protein